ncbi:MAG: site-specific integrase [Oscillospiraceae bacterium]|nr:site-specific integrase [Oscillospiraceae bacterium]
MPKKSNKRRADGRIAVQVFIGAVNGKNKYKTIYGQTQKEVDKKAAELREMLGRGVDVLSDASFAFWAKKFLHSKQQEVSPSQYRFYAAKVDYLNNMLGTQEIRKIRPYQLQDIINELAAYNPHTKKPSAKKTLNDVKAVACQVFGYALCNAAVDVNPAEYIKIPALAPQSKRRALDEEEQQYVIHTPHRAQTAAMLMMFAGLRRGEATALTWSDIDFTAKTITINKSYDFKNNTVKRPKTLSGIRVITMPDILSDYLSEQPRDGLFVIMSAHGEQMTETAWKRMWESYMCELDFRYGNKLNKEKSKFSPNKIKGSTFEPFTPHCLRHTYATILYDAGVDVLTAQKLLGHSDVKTTLGIYTHLSTQKEKHDIAKLNDFLKCQSNVSQQNLKTLDI